MKNQKNLKSKIDLDFHILLLSLTKIIESVLLKCEGLLSKKNKKNTNKSILQKLNKTVQKQLIYLNRESIYYTRSLLYTFLVFLICSMLKFVLPLFLIVKIYQLFYLPKKSFYKLTMKYIINGITAIPLIVASTIFSGILGNRERTLLILMRR